ncbi:hypothetical protein E3J62_07750 [candidate division TA06 bacterium]|uniref:FlgD/Vpr Ig-like domain-containing protein n=1 Tax=candidate division TA06 bacterium TaxID=2250710 RepID=A0A523US21_UNCT6|nr:MAG: hypothetical protein E3J62_07750 [candidate division TA06 bacterium]
MSMSKSSLVLLVLAVLLGSGIASAQTDFLIWDADLNANSGPAIETALTSKGFQGIYTTDINPYLGSLTDYCAIFICLGVYDLNYALSPGAIVTALTSYLDNNGKIYMEGGDTWAYDTPTALHAYFNINGLEDGFGDVGTVLGQGGTFTAGMSFNYSGDNEYIDRLDPIATAVVVFANQTPAYNNGIAYDDGGGSYKTVGASFEFSGLDDATPPSTKADLADSIMSFFGCAPTLCDSNVSVVSINNPGTWVAPNSPTAPQATVQNIGLMTVSFDVTCVIDTAGSPVYTNTQSVVDLPSGNSQAVNFANWTPGGVGTCYDVTVYTQLVDDCQPENDTAFGNTCAFDTSWTIVSPLTTNPPTMDGNIGGAEWADAAQRDVSNILDNTMSNPGSAYLYVKNDSNNVYFGLDIIIDNTLDEWDAFISFFDDNNDGAWPVWPFPLEGQLYVEQHAAGDSIKFFAWNSDSGVQTFCDAGALQGAVGFGSGRVQYEIALPLLAIPDTFCGDYVSLQCGPCDTVGFWLTAIDLGTSPTSYPAWWPPTADYPGMLDPPRMGQLILSCGAIHDGGATSVTAPPDTVCIDSSYQVCAMVENFGAFSETFDAVATINGWTDTVQVVDLAPGSSVEICFANYWTVPSFADTSYTVTICTEVTDDNNSANDCASKSVYADSCIPAVHDGAVISKQFPPDTVMTDSTYQVEVMVVNFGNVSETFTVDFNIPAAIYAETESVFNLGAGATTSVSFANWTVPTTPDSFWYAWSACTQVTDDNNSANDCLMDSIFAWTDTTTIPGVEEGWRVAAIPTIFALGQSNPNPFDRTTAIRYQIPTPRHVTLRVYDIVGKRVRTLVDREKGAGYYTAVWDGRDDGGEELSSGVYFYCLKAWAGSGKEEFTATRKLVVMKK